MSAITTNPQLSELGKDVIGAAAGLYVVKRKLKSKCIAIFAVGDAFYIYWGRSKGLPMISKATVGSDGYVNVSALDNSTMAIDLVAKYATTVVVSYGSKIIVGYKCSVMDLLIANIGAAAANKAASYIQSTA